MLVSRNVLRKGGITIDKEFIYVFDEDKVWMKVRKREIYYIETIKSTHYCEVVMKDRIGKLHADIRPLQQELPEYFFRTRASTLANMLLVNRVDTSNRILYFDDSIFCTYTEKAAKEIKRLLHLYNYRNSGGSMI